MKRFRLPVPVISAIVLLALCQVMCGRERTPTPESNENKKSKQECNATQYLEVTSEITTQETNQFDTRLCEYTLKIYNNHLREKIRYFLLVHKEDGYQHTSSDTWIGDWFIERFETREWYGEVVIYTDKDFDSPVMTIVTKVAGVFDTEGCNYLFMDEDYLESISDSISSCCPLE